MSIKITWEERPAYPSLIKGAAAGAVNGRLLVAGGMPRTMNGFWLATEDTPEKTPSLVFPGEKIESHVDKWYPLPPLPIGPGWTSGAAVAGGFAVVGGRREGQVTADVLFLDVSAGATTWEKLPDRPSPAMVATTFADEDWLYTAFGSKWQPHEHATDDLNIYRMNVRNQCEWEVVTKFPGKPRWMCGMAVCNGKLYVIGGRDIPVGGLTDIQPRNAYTYQVDKYSFPAGDRVHFREAWEYDFDADEWKELPHPPRAFVADAFTVADRWIVLTGGASYVVHPEGEAVAIMRYVPDLDFVCYSYEVWAYDTQTGKWSNLDPLPYGVCSHRVATYGDYAYIVGNEIIDKKRGNAYGTVFEGCIEVL